MQSSTGILFPIHRHVVFSVHTFVFFLYEERLCRGSEASADFCGSCMPTFWETTGGSERGVNPSHDVLVSRRRPFQLYRTRRIFALLVKGVRVTVWPSPVVPVSRSLRLLLECPHGFSAVNSGRVGMSGNRQCPVGVGFDFTGRYAKFRLAKGRCWSIHSHQACGKKRRAGVGRSHDARFLHPLLFVSFMELRSIRLAFKNASWSFVQHRNLVRECTVLLLLWRGGERCTCRTVCTLVLFC